MKRDLLIMRAGAWLLDLVIIFVAGGLTLFLFLMLQTTLAGAFSKNPQMVNALFIGMVWAARVLIFLILPLVFDTWLTLGKTKATYGKVVFEVRALFEKGMDFPRVFLRSVLKYLPLGIACLLISGSFLKWLAYICLAWTLLDWVSPLFMPGRRAFHDFAAGSRVDFAGKNIEGEGLDQPGE